MIGIACQQESSKIEEIVVPVVQELSVSCTTGEAITTGYESAHLGGSCTISGADVPSGEAGFYYSPTASDPSSLRDSGEWATAGFISMQGGDFQADIKKLTPKTTYYYAAAVSINSRMTLGDVKSFTTPRAPLKMAAATGEAMYVTYHSAKLFAKADIHDMEGDLAEVCFYYSTITSEASALKSSGKKVDAGTVPAEGGAFSIDIGDLEGETTYYYMAAVSAEGQEEFGEVKEFMTLPTGAVDLGVICQKRFSRIDENGNRYYVTSPHKVYWAECNLGADKPEDYGDYYAWGVTETYYETSQAQDDNPTWKEGKSGGYSWSSYEWYGGEEVWEDAGGGWFSVYYSVSKYCPTVNANYWRGEGDPDNLIEMTTGPNGDDAASKLLGGKWRIPSYYEMEAFKEQCTFTWATRNGVNGYVVTSKEDGNDNSIFLPASGIRNNNAKEYLNERGYYWTSLIMEHPSNAWGLFFDSASVKWLFAGRASGCTIRPVTE